MKLQRYSDRISKVKMVYHASKFKDFIKEGMKEESNQTISYDLELNQDHRRFIYFGTLIIGIFLIVFALIDSIFLKLYVDAVAETIGAIVLLTIHHKESQNPIPPWLIIVGILTVVIVIMIAIFANNAADGVSIWIGIMPFICFLCLDKKIALMLSIVLNVLFIMTFSYFLIIYPEKGFNLIGVIASTGALTSNTFFAWFYAGNREKIIGLLIKQTRTDTLTPLLNRRGLMSYFNIFINLYKEDKQPLCVLILDLDNFKRINDSFGHDIGDEVIISCANTLKKELRETDAIARLGGEEYIVLLPNTTLIETKAFAHKIKDSIEDLSIDSSNNSPIKVTASIGIACASQQKCTFEALYKAADEALYKAKNNGRNCIFSS